MTQVTRPAAEPGEVTEGETLGGRTLGGAQAPTSLLVPPFGPLPLSAHLHPISSPSTTLTVEVGKALGLEAKVRPFLGAPTVLPASVSSPVKGA